MNLEWELRELKQRLRQMELEQAKGSLLVRMGAMPVSSSSTTSGGTGGTGGGGCCCPEGECLHVNGVDDADLDPAYYVFDGEGRLCGCTATNPLGELRLYPDPANAGQFKSSIAFSCHFPDCTATGQWLWPPGSVVTGTPGEAWVLVSNDNPDCGVPPRPDYDGAFDNDTAETTYRPAAEAGSYHLDPTAQTLTFNIGGAVIFTWHLESIRGWSRLCTNTFRLQTDGWKCSSIPPAVICVSPRTNSQQINCPGWERAADLPPIIIANFALTACDCAHPPSNIAMGLVGLDALLTGEIAAWQSGVFDWCNSACVNDGGECHERQVAGLPPLQYPVSLRLSLTGSCGQSTSISIDVHMGSGWGCVNGICSTGGAGPVLTQPEEIEAYAASLDFASVGYPGVGIGGPGGNYPFCGWIKAPSSTWAGGFHTFPNFPDHYVTLMLAVPPPTP